MAGKTKQSLGRGFDSLIPTDFDSSIVDGSERIQQIAINKISANPDQPRRHFDQTAISELAKSIEQYGILQPLIVIKKDDDSYMIVAGERRYRAAKEAKIKAVPVIVRSHKELEKLEIAIVENVQRVDLSPLEQAESIQKLHDQFSFSYPEIASKLGKAPTTVNNIARLMQLPKNAKEALSKNEISEGHARAVLALKGHDQKQQQLVDNIKKHGWSVRQAEQFVVSAKQGQKTNKGIEKKMAPTNSQTKELSKKLKTPVNIRRTAKGGRVEIAFKNDDQLASLLDQLSK